MAHTLAETLRCEVPVLFASTEGQTALIAIRLAAVLHEHGLDSEAIDVSTPQAQAIDWSRVHGALVGASLHMGRHQNAAARFVHEHAADLNAVPSTPIRSPMSSDVIFSATGVTDGSLLDGVHFRQGFAETETVVLRSKTGTVRRIKTSFRMIGTRTGA